MNSSQTPFLQKLKSQLGEYRYPTHLNSDSEYSNPEDNTISILDQYGFLTITGPDASKFLQGQTTCDLDEIDNTHSKPGACCSPKGRMISSFLLARTSGENYFLRMRTDLVGTTLDTLAKYIVFSKAKQNNCCSDYTAIGLSGKLASVAIINTFGSIPNEKYGTIVNEDNIVVQIDDEGYYFECWIQTDQLEAKWPSLSQDLIQQQSNNWELATIRRGQGEITQLTSAMFIPQMLNYHLTNAISFTKGCYTGQEVVARMQYKGKLKRHMYHIRIESEQVTAGDDLVTADNKQSIGKIVNLVKINNQQSQALAVIAKTIVESNNILHKKPSIVCTDEPESNKLDSLSSVKILPLPYAITETDM